MLYFSLNTENFIGFIDGWNKPDQLIKIMIIITDINDNNLITSRLFPDQCYSFGYSQPFNPF